MSEPLKSAGPGTTVLTDPLFTEALDTANDYFSDTIIDGLSLNI